MCRCVCANSESVDYHVPEVGLEVFDEFFTELLVFTEKKYLIEGTIVSVNVSLCERNGMIQKR